MWFYAAVMYVYALRVEKQQALIWDENVYPFRWYVRNFVKLLFYLVVIGWVVQMVVQVLGLKEQSLLMVQLKKLLHGQRLIILIMSLTAGITEEFLFRGYIFSRLEKLFNQPTVAILVTSVVFAVMHLSYGTFSNVLFPLLMSILFSWHYYTYRNLKILMFCHFLWDYLSMGITLK
jgi:hypothetical protein